MSSIPESSSALEPPSTSPVLAIASQESPRPCRATRYAENHLPEPAFSSSSLRVSPIAASMSECAPRSLECHRVSVCELTSFQRADRLARSRRTVRRRQGGRGGGRETRAVLPGNILAPGVVPSSGAVLHIASTRAIATRELLELEESRASGRHPRSQSCPQLPSPLYVSSTCVRHSMASRARLDIQTQRLHLPISARHILSGLLLLVVASVSVRKSRSLVRGRESPQCPKCVS
ncbi:hypothetical protein C8T65DRAFT_682000 [Cerioporus squamosus]|nr:hypothetical protein C8T65DRAFT_682000 [Cerioporus squamosus]